jgi:tRNA A-37 threonylcarbamoyl transferase component Bud32
MIKKNTWDVNWSVVPSEDRAAFESMSGLLKAPMETITRDSISGVSRLSLSQDYYVKAYTGRGGERLKQLLGISRFHRELRNLRYFAELGLGTPEIAASGQESFMGFLRSGALVTVGVSDSVTLEQLLESGQFYSQGRGAVRELLDQLAQAVKILHQRGFFHRDLKTRNILVRGFGGECELFFFDCPSGHHPRGHLQRRSVMRDLAYLERGLRGHVHRADLLYLYKAYRGRDKLSDKDRKLAIATLDYYGKRRMTRKRRGREEQRARNS